MVYSLLSQGRPLAYGECFWHHSFSDRLPTFPLKGSTGQHFHKLYCTFDRFPRMQKQLNLWSVNTFQIQELPIDIDRKGLFPMVLCLLPGTSTYLIYRICQCDGYGPRIFSLPPVLEFFDYRTICGSQCTVRTYIVVSRPILLSCST